MQNIIKLVRCEICVGNFIPSENGASLSRYLETNNLLPTYLLCLQGDKSLEEIKTGAVKVNQ